MRYLARILAIAFRRSLVRTDVLAAVLTAVAPAVYFTLGVAMPETFGLQLAFLVGGVVISVIALRLLAAPYVVWKEDQAAIAHLTNKLEEPTRRRREFFQERFLEDRAVLSKKLVAYAFVDVEPIALADFTPDQHINSMVLDAAPFLGDANFKKYWDVFCVAFRNVVAGARFWNEHRETLPEDRTSLIKGRLDYDFAAMKAAATSLVYILTENSDHEPAFNAAFADLTPRYEHVCFDGCPNALWIPPESQSLQDTPEEKQP